MNALVQRYQRTPPWVRLAVKFAAGVALGVLGHYMLYRIFLPVEPFIYVAF
jgi:hypothetical protein